MMHVCCSCGLVRYEVGGETTHPTACHCSIRRRTRGAPYVAWLGVARGAFRVIAGKPGRRKVGDAIFTIAELPVALAGFSGAVLGLRGARQGGLSSHDRFGLRDGRSG